MVGNRAQAPVRRVIWVNRFFHPDESATSIMLTDLVRDLAQHGHWDHHLVTSNASYAAHDPAKAVPVPGAVVHRIPAIGSTNKSLLVRLVNFALFYVGALIHLLHWTRRGDVIVALTDPPLIGVISGCVARIKHAQSIHWVQDIFPETASRLGFAKEAGLLDRTLRRLRNASWHRASVSVAIGENMRDYLAATGVSRAKVEVIQNWAGDHAIKPVARHKNDLRRHWDYSEEHCVVGYSGNLGRAHDIETKIAAMRIVHDRGAGGLRFLFIGGGAKQEALRNAARELPDNLIAFQPYQPLGQLAESLSVPDVHWISLQPDLEGLIVPSKLYGALAVGRPIIFIGDLNGEVARLIAEGECGQSFVPGDKERLAEYLLALNANATERTRLGTNARAFLDEKLRRADRIEQWRDLLASVTS